MRSRVPLTFGAGIDRATGRSSASPSSFVDLRNAWLEDARVRLRQGFGATGFPALAAGTDVLAICMLEATLDIVFVLYERSTRVVSVSRLNPLASPTMQSVGTWGTLNASATLPPVITWAESAGLLFLAHAEPTYSYRLPTKIYTPNATDATVGALSTLQADLNGDTTAADVYFRGVYAWNDSLWGYGYGEETSAATQNRPEIVRVSKPADPTKFVPEAYFIAGKRSTAVTGLAGLPNVGLVVGKTTSCYLVRGTDAETYGIDPLDMHHGNVADRSMVVARDAVWMWGLHGPRLTTGAPTIDMAASLALDAPQPATLTAPGDAVYAFGLYDPIADCVEFVWPRWSTPASPTLAYVASVRDPANIRWSYHERAACVSCASVVTLGKESPPPWSAYGDFTAQADAGIDSGTPSVRKVSVTWSNLGTYLGGESYEVYTQPSGGAWTLKTTVAHNGLSSQSLTISGFDPLRDYAIAIRAVRAGGYVTGYTDANPDNWTAGTAADSKTTVQTSCTQPVMQTSLWQRISASVETLDISFTMADTTAPFILERSADNVSWTTVATYAAPALSRTLSYTLQAGESGASRYFRVTPKRGSITGTSATAQLIYCGPAHTTHGYNLTVSMFERIAQRAHLLWSWVDVFSNPVARNVVNVQVQFSTDNVNWTTLTAPWAWEQLLRPYYQFTGVGLVTPGTNYFRWRSVVTFLGVSDYTPWQTVNWAGVNATAVPTFVQPSPYPPGFPFDPRLWDQNRQMDCAGTWTTGQSHWLVIDNGTGYRLMQLQTANGSAQTFAATPGSIGVSVWAGSVSVRYLVRESNGAGAKYDGGWATQPGGVP